MRHEFLKTGAKRMGAKKGRIGALPQNWQTRILEAARQREKTYGATYAPALAVLEATGCRPAELAKGVKIRRTESGWEFTIEGVKIGKTGGVAKQVERGVPYRFIVVRSSTALWSKVLTEEARKRGDRFEIKTSSADTIGTQMRRVAQSEWPDLTSAQLPSPYSYRHRMARDMKTQKMPAEDIAAALGHASCFSQKRYGRWRKGGGSEGPKRAAKSSVKARNGAKLLASRSPLAHFKKKALKGGMGGVPPMATRRPTR
jgi:integrase